VSGAFTKFFTLSGRENTFDGTWPHLDHQSGKNMAAAGFFRCPTSNPPSLNAADCVMCPFCAIVVYDWKKEDFPLQVHKRTRPNCPFITGLSIVVS
jgi:hypothetical protein